MTEASGARQTIWKAEDHVLRSRAARLRSVHEQPATCLNRGALQAAVAARSRTISRHSLGFAPYRGYSERQQPAGFGWSVPIGIGELFVYSWIEECVASLCQGSFRSLLLLTHLHLIASKATYVRFSFELETAEGKFVCNILPHKNLSRSQHHLMTEAPRKHGRF